MSDLTPDEARRFMNDWGSSEIKLKRYEAGSPPVKMTITLNGLYELFKMLQIDEKDWTE